MNIAFVLNGPSVVPVGGHKIVFEYANALSRKGHNVNIYFDCENGENKHHIPKSIMFIRRWFIGKFKIKWFSFHNRVYLQPIKKITSKNVGKNDVVITTAVIPAKNTYKALKSHNFILNFVQGYETWCLPEKELQEIYQQGKVNVVISKWLFEKIDEPAKEKAVYIPNGLDFSMWKMECPLEKRNPYSVAMLYSSLETKGSTYGIKALEQAKKEIPELEVVLFGTVPKNEQIPDWIIYCENAKPQQVQQIYNHSSIFINPSLGEGFGLTSIESMACGCALVTTDYDATKDYARNMENAIVVPKKDINSMSEAIVKLVKKEDLRMQIAENGRKYVTQHFLWETSFDSFEQILVNGTQRK